MNELKIKLAAIARDEAAYLPEWIFHHLDFGFDEIELYVNNTSDNSLAVLGPIAERYPVVISDANKLFQSSNNNFQLLAYQELTNKAIADGFSHIMFLDVDEFWTPADFKTNIKQALVNLDHPQALSLNWLIHCDEGEFSRCYDTNIKVQPDSHVKTIFKLDQQWDKLEIHNIIGKNIVYTRGDGSRYDFGDSPHCGLTDNKCIKHDYFVIHRMYRSQMEYVSLLGRGRANKLKLKDNRNGYYPPHRNFESIDIDKQLLAAYNERFDAFLACCQCEELLDNSHQFIIERYKKVLHWAKNADLDNAAIFYKLFDRIELDQVKQLRHALYQKVELASIDIDSLAEPRYSYLLLLLLAKMLKKCGFVSLSRQVFFRLSKQAPDIDGEQMVVSVETALLNLKYPINKHADVYREIALQCHKQKKLDLACYFIAKAQEKRPNGPYIVKLFNDFTMEKIQRKS